MFRDRLVDFMQKRNTNVNQVAKATGIGQSTVNNYVNEGHTPSLEKAAKIALHLNVSVDYLAGITDNPVIPSSDLDEYIMLAMYGEINEETVRNYEEVKRLVQLQKDRTKLPVFVAPDTSVLLEK